MVKPKSELLQAWTKCPLYITYTGIYSIYVALKEQMNIHIAIHLGSNIFNRQIKECVRNVPWSFSNRMLVNKVYIMRILNFKCFHHLKVWYSSIGNTDENHTNSVCTYSFLSFELYVTVLWQCNTYTIYAINKATNEPLNEYI